MSWKEWAIIIVLFTAAGYGISNERIEPCLEVDKMYDHTIICPQRQMPVQLIRRHYHTSDGWIYQEYKHHYFLSGKGDLIEIKDTCMLRTLHEYRINN